ncbi:uncharacterized protein LOC110723839 [Chenopodium quinoa]|uniref:uncharacterized protein LOC110723839 n=1 Tax=Chenopodium quinoa TaxID=63459 RepID=UPI000B7808EE|nr:uncharacterized protein LOC110723839 [Chenopodium quinoa]
MKNIAHGFLIQRNGEVIAATVSSDPMKYSEAFLGKTNEEYCAWILDLEKWGGSTMVELSDFLTAIWAPLSALSLFIVLNSLNLVLSSNTNHCNVQTPFGSIFCTRTNVAPWLMFSTSAIIFS